MLQYIGARYVPIFYQNSLDPNSTEWENNVSYEPMTWVSLPNGKMYISKKEVPANIGTPAQNGEYWLEAGQYNAYIQSLQDQIDDINDDITDMKDGTVAGSLQAQINTNASDITDMKDGTVAGSLQAQINTNASNISTNANNISTLDGRLDIYDANKIICIGDSYAINATAGGLSWINFLKLNNPDLIDISQGGTSFASDYISASSPNWQSMLTDYANTLTADQKKEIKQIVVAGGANDGNLLYDNTITLANLGARIEQFMGAAHTLFPNAIIKVAFIGWHRQKARFIAYASARDCYQQITSRFKYGAYYSNAEFIMHCRQYINSTDMIHPTQEASYLLGEAIGSIIAGGNYEFSYSTTSTFTKDAGINAVSYVTEFYSSFKGNHYHLDWLGTYSNNSYIQISFVAGGNMTINTGDAVVLGSLTYCPTGGIHPTLTPISAVCGIYGGGSTRVYGAITIQDGQLIYKHLSDTVNVSNMLLPWGSLEMPLNLN